MRDKFGPNSQQWIYDWIIKTTGRTDHWELSSVPQLPPEVKSWDMIPKVLGKQAARLEKVAEAAAAAGHTRTAWESYLRATSTYFDAQHFITEDDNPKKIALYTRLLACYDKVIEFNEYPIEKVELPFGDTTIPALLHLVPGVKKAPCLLYIRGMDQCKEVFPITMGTVMDNHFHKRGIHLFIIDGPGQGECNLRKIRTRPNNHVEAGKAAVDYLLTRPEVDHDAIGVYGASMGSYWASHIAAADPRISACMVGMLCIMMRRHAIFEEAAPKFRQIFKYMAGIRDDDEFDEMMSRLTLLEVGGKIKCPFLIFGGEFDPLSPIAEAEEFFEEVAGKKEMWVFEDDFHTPYARGLAGMPMAAAVSDWFLDTLQGKRPAENRVKLMVPPGGMGPYTALEA